MIIQTKTLYSGKGKLPMKFIIDRKKFERDFKVTFIGARSRNTFLYEVDDNFPKEVLNVIFGYNTMIVELKNKVVTKSFCS